jgi:uncharacterized protein
MAQYLTPGVYLRPKPRDERDLRLVRTDIAGFVGFAERGILPNAWMSEAELKRLPQRVNSWKEYRAHFGGFIPNGLMAYAVKAFFENGGQTAYIVRVAATDAKAQEQPRTASLLLAAGGAVTRTLQQDVTAGAREIEVTDAADLQSGQLVELASLGVIERVMIVGVNGKRLLLARPLSAEHTAAHAQMKIHNVGVTITARTAGNWGNRIRVTFLPLEPDPASGKVTSFSLRVKLAAGPDTGAPREEEFYSRLSLDLKEPFYAPARVNAISNLISISLSDQLKLTSDAPAFTALSSELQGGQDGLSALMARDMTGGIADLRGLRLLEEIDDIGILCAPDAVFELQQPVLPPPPSRNPCEPAPAPEAPVVDTGDETREPAALDPLTIYQSMIEQCERLRDRVAVLDTPRMLRGAGPLLIWRRRFNTKFAALYYPWLNVPDALNALGGTRAVPPCGHVAGVYARIDNQFGVQRPPANAELSFAVSSVETVDGEAQENLNPYDINCLRSFPGQGIRVWGARALASSSDADWRFIHVRRLMSMIEKSVDKSMQWAVFEPNDFSLRRTLAHSLRVFLERLWRTGGLKGDRAEQAYFVRCDETNNPQSVIDAGRLICQVGVAVAAPMEFIVFEIRQGGAQSEVLEQ